MGNIGIEVIASNGKKLSLEIWQGVQGSVKDRSTPSKLGLGKSYSVNPSVDRVRGIKKDSVSQND